MKSFIFYFITCLLLLASCKQSPKKYIDHNINSKDTLIITSDTISENQKWMQAINDKNIDLLSSLYTENAMVLSEKGVDLANRKEILELVPNSDFVVKSVSTIKKIKAHDNYDYEIGNFINKDGELAKHLIIWNTLNYNKRELEFITVATKTQINLGEIKKQRLQWMKLCNAHNAKTLIEAMYSKNTLYYNRGRLLKGRKDLISEYGYMNNPKYELTLNPILVEPVSDTIVYEFGQCKGSYNGKYILVWQKNSEGIWQILFDSNI